jgi:hypothetical protein
MSNEAPFQANFKTPKGALLNVRAWSEAELDQYLDALLQRVNVINEVELAIEAICNINTGGIKVASASGLPQPERPQGATQAPQQASVDAPLCDHNLPMRLVPAGISKAGKPYKAFYACPNSRETACSAKA